MNNFAEHRGKIFELLQRQNMTTKEIARMTGYDPKLVSTQLRRLKEYGMARTIGFSKSVPLWQAVAKDGERKKTVEFKPSSIDIREFRKSIKGTPWQGMDHFV